ncbi:hypothetical protein GGR50DRAFT_702102 [Xylaria sp. CBS 124048]|nr:hypothetical protein GGR50DRAFT_702102 [Xylaria sp. CBS 124048]
MQENRTLFWRNYFGFLKNTDLWDKDSIKDRIALLFLFMPIIRNEIAQFVQMWNGHRIRKQRTRQHVVPGIPYQLYNMPNPAQGYIDCRAPLDEEAWKGLMDAVERDGTDLDEYLPAITIKICHDLTQPYAGRLSTMVGFKEERPYMLEYERL